MYSIARITNLTQSAAKPLATGLPATPPENIWTNTDSATSFTIYRIVAGPP